MSKKKRRRGVRGNARARSAPGLPRNIRETFERGAELFDELQRGVTLEQAIDVRRRRLHDLLARFDSVHLLGQLVLSEMPMDPETYKESEHPGAAYVVEMIAAELLTRPSRAGASDVTPAIDAHVLDPARRLCREAMLLESFRRMSGAGDGASADSDVRGRAASHHLMLRGPGWPWQEHDTLRGLFGPTRFAERLKSVLGFDVEDGISCSETVSQLVVKRLEDHMSNARAGAASFGEDHPAYEWADASLSGWQEAGPNHVRAHAVTALWALNTLGDSLLVEAEALAAAADVDLAAAAGFLSSLSVAAGQTGSNWFELAETVRFRPFIDYGSDGFMPTVIGNDLWALRGVFEAVLKGGSGYFLHRGQWLERRAADLLARALDPEHVLTSVDYSYNADGEAVTGEIDALLVCGDTAIVIEAKSATLRPGARRGGEAFIKHLRDNVTKAAQQGTRAQRALGESGTLRKRGEVLRLPTIREVHPVVVTLDDLSAAAPVLWQLQGTRVMPDGVTIPWVVTLHELELVAGTIEWPPQFVHFLRRRSRLNQLGYLTASDELDWWMHYLSVGLYFEDDSRREPTRLASHTDPLDAWVLYERGMRKTPAPKPAMPLDRTSRGFLDTLCDERPPAWVAAACMLLDINGNARKKLWRSIDRMRPRARTRGRAQRLTLGFEGPPEPFLICAAVLPNEESDRLSQVIEQLVAERIGEHDHQRVLAIGTTVGSRRPYDVLGVLDRTWWKPPADPGAT